MILNLATHPARFVTVPDLIAYLGAPRQTVYWHVRNHKLPTVRIGRHLRVETAIAREWVELWWRPKTVS